MEAAFLPFGSARLLVSRSGYTGEDGFELLAPAAVAYALWNQLLSDPRVKPAGLAARDTLRLEAGLPLYGQDLDESISPVEAGLGFVLSARRLEAGDFPGAERIRRELAEGPQRFRIALKIQGAPARAHTPIAADGQLIGRVTSGGFSPSLGIPIALGFTPPQFGVPGTDLSVTVRHRAQKATAVPLPFVPHRYARKA
jgi:aminomethyltransferase